MRENYVRLEPDARVALEQQMRSLMQPTAGEAGAWHYPPGWNSLRVVEHLRVAGYACVTINHVRQMRQERWPRHAPLPAPLTEPPRMPDVPEQAASKPEPEPEPTPRAPLDMLIACRDFIKAEVSRQLGEALKNRTTIKTHNGLVDKHNGLCDDVAVLQKKYAKLTADMQSLMTWATERGAPNADLGFPSE